MVAEQAAGWMWGTGFIAFAFGLVFGMGLAMVAFKGFGRSTKLQKEVDRLQQELDDYKGKVTEHFKQTSVLVQKMTDSYRDVYQHLASSSQQLCQEPIDTPQLDFSGQAPQLETESGSSRPADDGNGADKPAKSSTGDSLDDAPFIPAHENQARTADNPHSP